MSHRLRRPRALLLAAAALLAACAPDAATGPRALRARTHVTPPAHDPILFVHGWNASGSTWTTMVARFRADGYTSGELANWTYLYTQSNAVTAEQIRLKVDSILDATGAAKVDIISHSMGALSARYYVRNLGGTAKVDAWVSLGGTNYGTTTAYACTSTPCKEMWPNSPFIQALNSGDDSPGPLRYATWRSPCDEAIVPAKNAQLLDGPRNTETRCMSHAQLHEDLGVYTQVRDWVKPTGQAAAVLASLTPAWRDGL